jgi:N-acetylneuraminic acid mutarotase
MKQLSKLFIAITLFILQTVDYSFGQLSWVRVADVPVAMGRFGPASMTLNGKGYVGMGADSNAAGHSDWFEYNASTGLWTQKASLPSIGRWTVVSLVIGNKGYVITGAATGGGYVSECWEYDPANDSWTAKAPFPGVGRQNAEGFVINNKGYVGLGYSAMTSYTDFYEFDPVANTWTAKAQFPGLARNGSVAFTANNKGYMGCGNAANNSYYNDFYEYDPVTDSWTQKATFPLGRLNGSTIYSNGTQGFILCGYFVRQTGIIDNPMNMLYKYDPATDAWSLEGTFCGLPRGYAGGFVINNDLYISAGSQRSTAQRSLTDTWKLANGLLLSAGNVPNEEEEFQIYPNPSGHTIAVEGNKGRKIEHIRIYNESGIFVKKIIFGEDQTEFNVSDLAQGIYFMEIITRKGEVIDSRFIKM